MGQLEKYGLYVLCLVIFLILGVTIWGNPERAPGLERTANAAMRAAAEGSGQLPGPGKVATAPGDEGVAKELQSLLGSDVLRGSRGQDPVRNEPPKPVPDKPVPDQPVAEPAAGGKTDPAVGADQKRGSYLVQSGDSFDSIARTKLGSASLRNELQRLNANVVPHKMQVGQELMLPSRAELARLTRPVAVAKVAVAKDAAVKVQGDQKVVVDAAADRVYTIGKGDNFERIARAELGSSKRVEELRELNPSVDPTRLRIGQRIKLPKK